MIRSISRGYQAGPGLLTIALASLLDCSSGPRELAAADEHALHLPAVAGSGPLGIPETRAASGTAGQPDSVPMRASHATLGSWTIMTHGSVFAAVTDEAGPRGGSRIFIANWLMGAARRPLAGGVFEGRLALSAEPWTIGSAGYPLLLQTGESFRGLPIHDRQHPHDLFMELAASYARELTRTIGIQLYAAPVGEPAFGPVAFPHRVSAASNAVAPLGHHHQDSTHVSFGVLTAGLFTRHVKVEGSWFNGREPDENRLGFDVRPLDSYSGRIALNLFGALAFQISYANLESPEALRPDESSRRVTCSVTFHTPVGRNGSWSATSIWGRDVPWRDVTPDAMLVESELDFDGVNTVFGRAEVVRRSARELAVVTEAVTNSFSVGALTLGYVRELVPVASWTAGLGLRATLNFVGEELASTYGSRRPICTMLFVRLRPGKMALVPIDDTAVHAHPTKAPRRG